MAENNKNLIFIETVKSYPLLYNPEDPEYDMSEKKKLIWGKIAEECNLQNGTIARRRWKKFCNYYWEILDKEMKNGTNCPFWIYKQPMKFLSDFVKYSKNKKQDPEWEPSSDSDVSESEETESANVNEEKFDINQKTDTNLATDGLILHYLQQKCTDKKKSGDSLNLFFKSMERLVRKFSAIKQLEIKYKMAHIIFAAEAEEVGGRSGTQLGNNVMRMRTSNDSHNLMHLNPFTMFPPNQMPNMPNSFPANQHVPHYVPHPASFPSDRQSTHHPHKKPKQDK